MPPILSTENRGISHVSQQTCELSTSTNSFDFKRRINCTSHSKLVDIPVQMDHQSTNSLDPNNWNLNYTWNAPRPDGNLQIIKQILRSYQPKSKLHVGHPTSRSELVTPQAIPPSGIRTIQSRQSLTRKSAGVTVYMRNHCYISASVSYISLCTLLRSCICLCVCVCVCMWSVYRAHAHARTYAREHSITQNVPLLSYVP